MDVDFYTTAAGEEVIVEFLDSLPRKDHAKLLRDIDLLADYGPNLHEPYTRHIDGAIWELRSKFSTNTHRIFYFIRSDNKLVLLHGFTKKTQQTPPSEIKVAKQRLADYRQRHG